uniref:Cytochrome c-like n=1 Tax=Saccoglossus kowalevskii TaxID=10224 RepID=A0ABM0GRC4_SACKO|nr:PREDICTED: cytochrome c-like [Saccoglossus kowalevskii]
MGQKPSSVPEATAELDKLKNKAKTEISKYQQDSLSKKDEVVEPSDPQRGRDVFVRECEHCHTIEKGGEHKFGPNLQNLFNRKAGELEGFTYRDLDRWTEKDITWTDQTLDEYLADPGNYVPGTKTFFKPLPSKQDRIDLIAYLHEATKDD